MNQVFLGCLEPLHLSHSRMPYRLVSAKSLLPVNVPSYHTRLLITRDKHLVFELLVLLPQSHRVPSVRLTQADYTNDPRRSLMPGLKRGCRPRGVSWLLS
jgi:hypothetical protein